MNQGKVDDIGMMQSFLFMPNVLMGMRRYTTGPILSHEAFVVQRKREKGVSNSMCNCLESSHAQLLL